MNRMEIESTIADRTQINRKVVAEVFDAFLDLSVEALSAGRPLRLTGFATISTKELPARIGRNPKTGEEIEIPSMKKVKISAGRKLKEALR